MGRYGGAPSLEALIKETKTGQYTAALHVGDFAYDLFSDGGENGDEFMRRIVPIASTLPYMTCPGNHGNYYHNLRNPPPKHVFAVQTMLRKLQL